MMEILDEARAQISGYKTYLASAFTGIYAVMFVHPISVDLLALAVLSATLRAAIAKGPTPPTYEIINGELTLEGRSSRRANQGDS